MLEGTTLSEGRGTTRPLELVRRARPRRRALLRAHGQRSRRSGCAGCRPAPVLVRADVPQARRRSSAPALQIHVDDPAYDHARLPPVAARRPRLQGAAHAAPRLSALARLRSTSTSRDGWRSTCLNGGCELRDWVDDPASSIADLERSTTARDEAAHGRRSGAAWRSTEMGGAAVRGSSRAPPAEDVVAALRDTAPSSSRSARPRPARALQRGDRSDPRAGEPRARRI